MTTGSRWEVVVGAGATLGEGPIWTDGSLWWVDIDEGRIHRTTTATGVDEVEELGEPVGAVIPRRQGGYVVGVVDGIALFDADGREQRRIPIEVDDTEARMNDAKCDRAGRLFSGTMTHAHRRSALYCIDPDGSVTTVFGGLGISNGLGWNGDSTRMYHIDTPTMRVDVVDYDLATGATENRRAFVEMTDTMGQPDGMTIDADDGIWVAFWEGWCVRRFDPAGALVRTIDLPVARVTSVTFGGTDLDELYVTTARDEPTDAASDAQPLAGALFRVDPGCRGLQAEVFGG